jgi:hypothetical protein
MLKSEKASLVKSLLRVSSSGSERERERERKELG